MRFSKKYQLDGTEVRFCDLAVGEKYEPVAKMGANWPHSTGFPMKKIANGMKTMGYPDGVGQAMPLDDAGNPTGNKYGENIGWLCVVRRVRSYGKAG